MGQGAASREIDEVRAGVLYICGTPIGNLGDASRRLIETLRAVDVIAAEDTRVARKLLSALGVEGKALVSFHEHNKWKRIPEILSMLKRGKSVALVTDAGMPAISDPGWELVKATLDEGLKVTVVPGPSASVSALVVSGIRPCPFTFVGFLPRDRKERREALARIARRSETLVIYEAPHRVEDCLEDILDILGERRMALVRELTKKFEEVRRGKVSEILSSVRKDPPKGEITLVVEGVATEEETTPSNLEGILPRLREAYEELTREGIPPNKVLSLLARLTGVRKRQLYKLLKVGKD
ncbi:MAG TPA: 16S rRNA (cytidine(1402)-2'-O)-methyltransferase [Armatimonadetes bacterium]|nr:16S rRNA (cytidine(1402)-2'-O)-methyltransferase [Armatimonadota bacterium]